MHSTYLPYIEQLVHILNLSIFQGVLPSELKTACVIPVYKDDNDMVKVIIGLFLLTVFPNIFERVVYNRCLIKKHDK